MAAVIIGVDPHKGSHTAVAIGPAEEPMGELRVRACTAQAERMLAWAVAWHLWFRDRPADQPANLTEDFPELAKDFMLPVELSHVTQHQFSSVLRISGLVDMWLHYDVSLAPCLTDGA